ncbi:hypothetical protein IJJ53_01140 [Candidatus Saccharibacteria bacterium]|nr:hypothetical protein [Candidatus Saccharibacteria bacterium]
MKNNKNKLKRCFTDKILCGVLIVIFLMIFKMADDIKKAMIKTIIAKMKKNNL